jgi:flavin reductase (DIM6/NTAB) family NADH-FMN oxidoreductase RutF
MTDTGARAEATMPLDPDEFKQALRRWASGVTVVTAKAGDEIRGMTVSAFSSVSADPPLVLVCANRSSRTHGTILRAGRFNVNILGREQESLSGRFASSDTEESRFEGVPYRLGELGAPVLEGALATLECTVASSHEEGSHTIYIGHVKACHVTDTEPLVYFQGSYRELR